MLEDAAELAGRREWAQQLAVRIERSGWNRQQLAKAIGVSRAQLDKYANGLVTVPGKYLGRIADHIDFDVYDQLASLGWLGTVGARRAREQRLQHSWRGVHDEVQRLVATDADISGARPASAIVDALVQEGWRLRHWIDWRGERRRVAYLDILELEPPPGSRGLMEAEIVPVGDAALPLVDRAARTGLTTEEVRWRDEAEAVLGTVFHRHECYWSERRRHASGYRGYPPAKHPGLVLAVPWLLRRRLPQDTAAVLRGARRATGTGDVEAVPDSLLILGLPYSGAPDVACILAGEVLQWGSAGVALLTRERWQSVVWKGRGDREARTAASIAAGDDLRTRRTVWFFNEPEAIEAAAPLLADSPSPPAVVHLRATDRMIDEFLIPEWGRVAGRSRDDIMHWRNQCDVVVGGYRKARRQDNVLTLDVSLGPEHRDYHGEDARSDIYVLDLARQVEAWLDERFQVRREPIGSDEQELLDVLASTDDSMTLADCAEALGISVPAARLLIDKVMTRQGLGSRQDLASFAVWRGGEDGRRR